MTRLTTLALPTSANTPPLSALGGDAGGSLLGLVLVVVIVALLSGTFYGLSRAHHYWTHASHLNLFLSLCRHHGLDFRTRGLLRKVVRSFGLSQPGLVFVDPRWLDQAAEQASLRTRAGELKRLRGQLFGPGDHCATKW